jgi:UDP-N-acetylmuramoylalanine--D-glutamate ligase
VSGRFAGERAVVVGAGVAGVAAARVLAAEGAVVRVSEVRDTADPVATDELAAAGIESIVGGHDPSHLDGATLVVTSPGVAPDAPILRWSRERGLRVWGEMELGARVCHVPYVAVTGTNGKTTTTDLIARCLSASGLDAIACGNIGRPFPSAALEDHDALVVECSSFQLAEQDSLHPRVSVLLNLAPDHLDWHGSYEAYVAAKARIFANQTSEEWHVGNLDDEAARSVSHRAPCRGAWFTLGPPPATGPAAGYEDGWLVAVSDVAARLSRPADGTQPMLRADAAACAAACLAYGVGVDAIDEGIRGFAPAPHRGETVAVVGGVRFVDNSKATNVHAAVAAVSGFDDVVLVAGGRAKGVDLSPLASVAGRIRSVVAIGEAAPDLMRVFEGVRPVTTAATIEEAVDEAFSRARPNGTVLLAPACASWDQFANYAERGDRFAAAARLLPEVSAHGQR